MHVGMDKSMFYTNSSLSTNAQAILSPFLYRQKRGPILASPKQNGPHHMKHETQGQPRKFFRVYLVCLMVMVAVDMLTSNTPQTGDALKTAVCHATIVGPDGRGHRRGQPARYDT